MGSRNVVPILLTMTLDGNEKSASRPAALLEEKEPLTHWTGSWVSLRAAIDAVEE
jgi:hypothetical protein